MKKNYKLSIAVALIISAISAIAQNPDVYVGGIKNSQAAMWKNGIPKLIGYGEEVNALIVIGEDVYAAGLNQEGLATVWKNDEVLFSLSDFDYYIRYVTSMAFHGDDLYVTTTDITSDWSYIARVWVNGVASDGYSDAAELQRICFDGDDVYVAGRTNDAAVIWKNGEPLFTHTSNAPGFAQAMFTDAQVIDGDVYYIGGDFGGGGRYAARKNTEDANLDQENNRDLSINIWKNGEVLYALANVAYDPQLAVSNGTVYACGQVPNGSICSAIVWIDGEGTIISNEWSGAQGMCVYKDDVYVTGFVGNVPETDVFIWKDGELTTFTSEGYDRGYCIVVVGDSTGAEETQDFCNVYPNPAHDLISIEGVEFEEAILYNSLGQIVVTTHNNKIDVSSLESGLYLLKLDNGITRNIVVKH